MFTSPGEFKAALQKPEIQAAFRLTIVSCTVAAILSVWIGTPLGYLLSRYKFPGRWLVDTIVDIPIVLPPLVLGLSLLILFHIDFGPSESVPDPTSQQSLQVDDEGKLLTEDTSLADETETQSPSPPTEPADESASSEATNAESEAEQEAEVPQKGWHLEQWLRDDVGFPVTYYWPAVVLAQFSVACAFAVRTMRVTFDQINPRMEDVARTLGSTRGQAFLQIALPQAWKGVIAAGTIAWARALGEFGPIMVFAGATRMRTEVLSTTVFLELSIGNLDAAVAVSLLMVLMAVVVLLVLRGLGTGLST